VLGGKISELSHGGGGGNSHDGKKGDNLHSMSILLDKKKSTELNK
jgi:hypothetical protein